MATVNQDSSVIELNDGFLNIYKFLNLVNANGDNKSNCLYTSSIFKILNVLYEGSDGQSRKELDETYLKTLIKASPEPMCRRSAVLIRQEYDFNSSYRQLLEKDYVLDVIPTDDGSVQEINEKIELKFPKWLDKQEKFIRNPLTDEALRVFVKDQSYFKGFWEKEFCLTETTEEDFHVGDDKTVKISMMNRTVNGLYTYYDEEKECDFISVPYARKNQSMLIVMPSKPHTKKQLVEFLIEKLSGRDIIDFHNNKGKWDDSYNKFSLPKFEFETDWKLTNILGDNSQLSSEATKYCPYLKTISDVERLNLKGMADNFSTGLESLDVSLSTKIVNNESGTFIKATGVVAAFDGSSQSKKMNVNKSFIFMILSADGTICSEGMFVG